MTRRRERSALAGWATGGGPVFPVTVKGVDGVCRVRTVSGLVRQHGLAPGSSAVW